MAYAWVVHRDWPSRSKRSGFKSFFSRFWCPPTRGATLCCPTCKRIAIAYDLPQHFIFFGACQSRYYTARPSFLLWAKHDDRNFARRLLLCDCPRVHCRGTPASFDQDDSSQDTVLNEFCGRVDVRDRSPALDASCSRYAGFRIKSRRRCAGGGFDHVPFDAGIPSAP